MTKINGKKVNNARMPDIKSIIALGINPKTGLPRKMEASSAKECLDSSILANLRVLDEQCALSRYRWYNLPDGLTGDLMERMMFYRGQVAMFYEPLTEKFYCLPFRAADLNCYGRYTKLTPLPFAGGKTITDINGKEIEEPFLPELELTPVYEVIDPADLNLDIFNKGCVIIRDYSEQLSQTILPRQALNDPILRVESQMIPFARTALINSTGVTGLRVNNETEQGDALEASESIEEAALTGKKYIPIVGNLDFQDLTSGGLGKADEFFMGLQAIDNFRLGLYGLENGGVFNKNTYQSTGEVSMNVGAASIPLMNGLQLRQQACDIINSIWGLGVWCELSEIATGADRNMDGVIGDTEDQSGANEGTQPAGGVNNNNE